MAESLFTDQVPAVGDASDGAPGITTGTSVMFAEAGSVTHGRFYATATVSGTYTVALYQVTDSDDTPAGTLLASKVAGVAPTAGTWNQIAYDSPVAVTTGVLYRTVVHSSAGRYVATNGFFSGQLVNGSITAPANGSDPVLLGTLRQGVFTINAALTYPGSGGASASYFADVVFVPDSEPASGTLAAVLPALTAAASGTASSSAAVAAVLPALTAAATGTASGSGTVAAVLPALAVSVTGAIDLGETSSPTRALATVTRPQPIATTTRDRVIATGTSPGGGQ